MIRKILPVLVPVLALVGGVAAGTVMQPGAAATDPAAADHAAGDHAAPPADAHAAAAPTAHDAEGADGHGGATEAGEAPGPGWFTFPGQFFVPLARNGDMGAMMILTLVLETEASRVEALEQQEHRLRDALLRQLLLQANTGGFDGNYTVDRNIERLKEDLLRVAKGATDIPVSAVLIQDIVRQDG